MKLKDKLFFDELVNFDFETPLQPIIVDSTGESSVENVPGKNSSLKINVTIGSNAFTVSGKRDVVMGMLDIFLTMTKAEFAAADAKAQQTKETPF